MAYPNDWALGDEQCTFPSQHGNAASQYNYGWDAWLPPPHVMNLSFNQNGSPTYDQMSAAMPVNQGNQMVGRCRAVGHYGAQVGGGACCNGCKSGKGCEGDKQVGRGFGFRSRYLGNPEEHVYLGNPEEQSVGATRAIPFSKATELNDEAAKLSAAVGQWAIKIVGAFQPGDGAETIAAKFPKPADGQFFLAFRQWKAEWDTFYAWRRDNPPPWYSPIPSSAMTEAYGDLPQYDALLGRYQALLAQFTAMGGATDAKVPDQTSPFDKGLEEGGESAGKTVAKVFATIGTAGTLALLGLGLYIVAPLIPGMVSGARSALKPSK